MTRIEQVQEAFKKTATLMTSQEAQLMPETVLDSTVFIATMDRMLYAPSNPFDFLGDERKNPDAVV